MCVIAAIARIANLRRGQLSGAKQCRCSGLRRDTLVDLFDTRRTKGFSVQRQVVSFRNSFATR